MVYNCYNNFLVCSHILITFLSDEECTITLENIMMFTTGLTTFPPLGFPVGPTVTFLHEEDGHGKSRFPKANTCACILMLPTTHQTYESFELAMCYGIGNAGGFGFAWDSAWMTFDKALRIVYIHINMFIKKIKHTTHWYKCVHKCIRVVYSANHRRIWIMNHSDMHVPPTTQTLRTHYSVSVYEGQCKPSR